jgi:hypothetical protein
MAQRRFTIKLRQLRCLIESDPGPSEPYLWVTYFALGPQIPPFQTGPLAVQTPSYDAFRTEFPDGVSAGTAVDVPSFIASASFDFDPESAGPKLLGCVAVLMEEDSTRHSDIVHGRIAYTKEMEKQLNDLMRRRIQTNNAGPLTEEEIETIKTAVTSKVEAAVGSGQSIFDFFRDQDDPLGFTYKILPGGEGEAIVAETFQFPEIVTTRNGVATDRYVLSGEITVAPVPGTTVDLCAGPRGELTSKQQEITSLQHRRTALQQMLQTATPQQKPALIREIQDTGDMIAQAEAAIPGLQANLNSCTERFDIHVDDRDVVVGPVG